MKKLTKKQLLATGVVIALGVGGGSALYANHANNIHKQKLMQVQAETKAHAEKLKKEKLAKEKQELQEQIKSIDNVMAIAIKNPTESSIKTATEAVSKLKDKSKKSAYENTLKTLNQRLALINKARSSVKDYQEHATNADKQKEAQNAINALTDKNDSDVKAELQKMFDESNRQAQEASKASSKEQQVSSNNNSQSKQENEPTTANSEQQNVTASQGNTASNSNGATTSNNTPAYNGGGASSTNSGANSNQNNSNQNNSNNGNGSSNSNNGNSNNNNGNSNVTPPPTTTKYLGWVSVDGVIKYSQTFSTAGEAQQYALSMYRQEGASNWDADDISWGVRPVQG